MANMATLLKNEITRLARKEIRIEIEGLRKQSAQYRSEIAALKRRVATLEKNVSRVDRSTKKSEAESNADAATRIRFSAKGFKSLRQRLALTAETMGSLLAVTAQTIYNWEAGNSRPRAEQMARIGALRGMGKREVDSILKQLAK